MTMNMNISEIYNAVRNFAAPDPNAPDWRAHTQNQVRSVVRTEVSALFDRLFYTSTPTIDPKTHVDLGIQCLPLLLRTDGQQQSGELFFRPLTEAWLEDHPIERDDRTTMRLVAHAAGNWAMPSHPGDYADASLLSGTMSSEFRLYERATGGDLGMSTMHEMTGWVLRPPVRDLHENKYMRHNGVPEGAEQPAFCKTRLGDSWARDDGRPHYTCILEHACPTDEIDDGNEDLLRTELLAILGLTRERLCGYTMLETKVVPVTVISCNNGCSARILQAWYIDNELVVYKSPYYNFHTEEVRQRNLRLFLLYLGSQPVGDTTASF